jgi:hypothetical protein
MPENGSDYCQCVRKRCERYGKCAECIEYHATKSKRYPEPYCKRLRRSIRGDMMEMTQKCA